MKYIPLCIATTFTVHLALTLQRGSHCSDRLLLHPSSDGAPLPQSDGGSQVDVGRLELAEPARMEAVHEASCPRTPDALLGMVGR